MNKFFLTIALFVFASAAFAEPSVTSVSPQLLEDVRSNNFFVKKAALESLLKFAKQNSLGNNKGAALLAAMTPYSPNQSSGGDIAIISLLQSSLLTSLGDREKDSSADFMDNMLKIATNRRTDSRVREMAISYLLRMANESFLHSLIDKAINPVDDSQAVKIPPAILEKLRVRIKVDDPVSILTKNGWGSIGAILSYFSKRREPEAAKVVGAIFQEIVGADTANAILESKTKDAKDEDERSGLSQLRNSLLKVQ